MTRSWRRPLLAAALSLTAGVAGLVVSTPAQAGLPQTWSFSVVGEPGDPITAGNSYSYSSSNPTPGDEMNAWGDTNQQFFGMEFWSSADNFWHLTLQAPTGEKLKPGDTYQNVGQPYSDAAGMNLDNAGWGRSCSQSIGSFTVVDVAWGPYGYLERFDATFDYRCEGATGGSHGEIHIGNPPPVPALDATVTVNPTATVDNKGIATVRGTLTCTRAETLSVDGRLSQQQKKAGLVQAWYSTSVPCTPGQEVPWSASTYPADLHFERGTAQAVTEVPIRDFVYWQEFTVTDTSTITLTR
ncbi:hypothetical protein ACFFMM_04850 [Micromonospora chaiyaphumensis]|uniref:Enoyl reductase n=1 Tax=Micromonospora chaiyaphumensis TaxID=307119 RepID=A0A1C4V845_9ACTN|nr:hypothetical protein [Micromonospora chaiyaphumensis]SCE80194.1 hypothetical protein GA0070214_102123 [Micromonospora chaiyaphumensis]